MLPEGYSFCFCFYMRFVYITFSSYQSRIVIKPKKNRLPARGPAGARNRANDMGNGTKRSKDVHSQISIFRL